VQKHGFRRAQISSFSNGRSQERVITAWRSSSIACQPRLLRLCASCASGPAAGHRISVGLLLILGGLLSFLTILCI
jgi:hypothetical protein